MFLLLGNLFWARYRYRFLKYGLVKYPAWTSLIAIGICVPFSSFLCITSNILSMSVCFGKNLCTILVVSSKSLNSGESLIWDLSGFSYISEMIPSWYGEFSSKSVFVGVQI